MASLAGKHRDRAIDVGLALAAFVLTLALFASGGVDAGSAEEDVRNADALGVVLAALSSLPLIARRRWPLGVYVAVMAANAAMNSLEYAGGPPFGPAIALYSLAATDLSRRPPLRTTVAVVVSVFVAHFVVYGLARDAFPAVELLLGTSLWTAAWFVGDRVRLRRERMAELEERALRAEREAERERRLAAAEERTRIARDLHDSAGHAINVILVQAGAARLLGEKDPERARGALETIESVARETLTEIDQLVRALREDDARGEVALPTGLAALESLADRHRQAGLHVALDVRGPRRPLAPALDQAAYRIVQESLTNALRHGTGAADVALRFASDALEIDVANVAPGNGAVEHGHGLVGMRERAALVGGSLEAGRSNGVFRVRARLPYGAQT